MVDIQPILANWAYPTLALLLSGFAMWLMARSSSWLSAHASFLNAQTKAKILDLENDAINTGAAIVTAQAKAAGAQLHPTIDNPFVRFGVNVALSHAGGILANNGMSPDEVAVKILAKLPDNIVATDTTGQVVKTTTVTTEALPPATA